jgi:hypothetical protein
LGELLSGRLARSAPSSTRYRSMHWLAGRSLNCARMHQTHMLRQMPSACWGPFSENVIFNAFIYN